MKKFYLKYIQEVHVCSLKKRTYLKRAQSGKNLELTAFVCLDWMCTRTWTSPCVSITSTPHTTPTSAASSSGASPTWRCTGKLTLSCLTSCHSWQEQRGDVQARRCIKERVKQTMTKLGCLTFEKTSSNENEMTDQLIPEPIRK